MNGPIPIIILGGSDSRLPQRPAALAAGEMLGGFKGTHRLPWGRPLIGELVQRVRGSGRFCDPIVVGPRRLYRQVLDCEVVDVEGPLPATLQRTVRLAQERFHPLAPIAFCTCDILPQPDELRCLFDRLYQPHRDCLFWCLLVEAQAEDLQAGAWKPSYRLAPETGRPPRNLYPGHFVIARPAALRHRLMNYLLGLAYRYRNVRLRRRWFPMLVRGLGWMMREDVRNLLRFRPSLLTVSIPYICLRDYRRLRRQRLTLEQLADSVARVFLHRRPRAAAHGPPVVFSVTQMVSFAKDIDTKSELAEAVPVIEPEQA